MRGETLINGDDALELLFQSTPLMRGETRVEPKNRVLTLISIHSPHARGDQLVALSPCLGLISIHSPHARGDACTGSDTG